jgi:hypothetical protein
MVKCNKNFDQFGIISHAPPVSIFDMLHRLTGPWPKPMSPIQNMMASQQETCAPKAALSDAFRFIRDGF